MQGERVGDRRARGVRDRARWRADTLDEIRARGALVWGADAQGGAPFEFPDPEQPARLVGFEVELAEALAAQLGVGARMQQGAWDQLLELLARGDFDLALSGLEATPDKHAVCLMSRPYYVSPERLTVRRGDANAPRTLAALRGRRIGTLPSSAAERILRAAGAESRPTTAGRTTSTTTCASAGSTRCCSTRP
jgi:polar amino acid transport system substrate-binding protein